ncbi:hypothetical protein FCK90_13845 [Kocuria coralli]|uniref:Uncharacterized protein n=1 Tax=Kocuria coralli TaxID=1461025 RepID=A0A5J5KTS4_9MICC|nr:hypothetical protein [Kocuria coralli]KAA9393129.1 hypothetical protein FCK90_13845 [Kocuria coralli]
MSLPRRGEALITHVDVEVRLEGKNGPFVPSEAVLQATRRGMLSMLNHSVSLMVQDQDMGDRLPQIAVNYQSPVPGTYTIQLVAMDPRSAVWRFLLPVPEAKRQAAHMWLRKGAEMLAATIQSVPPLVVAKSIRVSSKGDDDGFCTVVIDERRTFRIPVLVFTLFFSVPEVAAASRQMLTSFLLPDLKTIVVVRDPTCPNRRHEIVLDLTEEFHQQVKSSDFEVLLAKAIFDDAPLRELMTSTQRRQVFGTGISGMGPLD